MHEAFTKRANILVFGMSLRQNSKAGKIWFVTTSSSFSVLLASPLSAQGAVFDLGLIQDLDSPILIKVLLF